MITGITTDNTFTPKMEDNKFDPFMKAAEKSINEFSKTADNIEEEFSSEDVNIKPEKDSTFKKAMKVVKEKVSDERFYDLIKSQDVSSEIFSEMKNEELRETPRPKNPSEEYINNINKATHTPKTKSEKEIIDEIRKESESEFHRIKPKPRKLCSYTIGTDIIEDIDLMSKEIGMNKSRFIEYLVKKYKTDKESTQKNSFTVANAAGPIDLPIDKISEKVFKHLVDNGFVKAYE